MTDAPACPECGSDVFVSRPGGDPGAAWYCHACELRFETPLQFKAERGRPYSSG